jgi:sec-independent protein translocase protein TatA
MLGLSAWKIAVIVGVAAVLFGRGKISELMGDVAKGIKSFKRGLAEDDDAPPAMAHVTAADGEKTARPS